MSLVGLSSTSWIPEDDLLLKNALEGGASLEALAKGAVQFSQRFTFQELQNRWHSLLYDPDISAQASAGMGELQSFASNISSEFNNSDRVKQSKMVHEKRKVGNICKQYNVRRKRIRSELFSSSDLFFLAKPNPHNCNGNGGNLHEHVTLDNGPPVGNYMLGDCMPNHFGVQETDFNILHHAFPQTISGISTTNDVANIAYAFHTEGPDSLADNQISRVATNDCLYRFPVDISSLSVQDLLKNDATKSFQQSCAHKTIPHSLECNSVDLWECSGVEEMGSTQLLPDTKLFEINDSETKPLSTFDSTNNNLQNICSEFRGRQHLNSPNSDGSALFHTTGFSPILPCMPLWKTAEDISAPAMPVNVSPRDKRQGAGDVSVIPDNDDIKRRSSSGHGVIHSGPVLTERRNSDGFINLTVMSDSEFADLSDSLLEFSKEDDILFMDVDGNDKMDKSSYDNSLLFKDGSESDAPEVEPKAMIVSTTGLATGSSACPIEMEVITSHLHCVHGYHLSGSHSRVNMPSTLVLNSKLVELNHGDTYCTLNTEDPEIPCNDDISLLIHSASSFASFATRPIIIDAIDHVPSANEDSEQGLNFMKKREDPAQSFIPSQMLVPHGLPTTSPDHSLVGCTIKSELADSSCMALSLRHANKAVGNTTQCRSAHTTLKSAADGKLENDSTKVELGLVDTLGTLREMPLNAAAGSAKVTLRESVINPLTSDQEFPESDNDVPCFSDIEAMILEMDLGSYDQDLYFTGQVSKYQHKDSKRKILRLEQCAQSCLQRTMASQGALAILYGRHLKHFIRKPEVILGRSTEEIDVDIDLGKEGYANKISRRQAIIKMERDGSFFFKNLGKSSVSVNGKTVANGESLGLSSSCLIEIRGMSFVFEMNHKSIRRYLVNISKKSQWTNFKWSPAELS